MNNVAAFDLVVDRMPGSQLKKQRLKKSLRKQIKRGGDLRSLPPEYRYMLCRARLMLGEYDWDGWEFRSDFSVTFHSLDLPRWDGSRTTVRVIGEQGLGDEIMFMSCLPDLIKRIGRENIIVECDGRLVDVFRRSFHVRTRARQPLSGEGQILAMGDLPRFYRADRSHFPGTPFLKPDRESFWRGWLDSLGGGKKIGVAWKARHGDIDPEKMRGEGIHIDLQYGDHKTPDWMIKPDLDPIKDFAEQINLISVLDEVRSDPQTVVHVAGALGVPCIVTMPTGTGEVDNSLMWCFGLKDTIPWYNSVTIER